MKRYISIDFLRGLAILLMLLLHVFIETFNTQIFLDAIQKGEGQIGFIILVAVLVYFASFAGLFISISGFCNCISMEDQFNALKNAGIPNAYKRVRQTQIIRGSVLFFLGYFYSAIIYPYVVKPLLQISIHIPIDVQWGDMVDELLWFNVIPFLGIATIIIGIIYTEMLKHQLSTQKMKRILWICVIGLYVFSPLILYAIRSIPGFWPGPWRNWDQRPIWKNIIFWLLITLAGLEQPLIPWIIATFIGTLIALDVRESSITKKFRQKWLRIAGIMFLLGILLQVGFYFIAETLEGEAKIHFEAGFGTIFGAEGRSSAYMLFIAGGEIAAITLMFWLVEGRRKAKRFARWTTIFRRAGMIALTLYLLQPFLLFPILGFEQAFGLPFRGNQETIEQSLIIMFACVGGWIVILYFWEKINFIGSFEWWTALLLGISKKDSKIRINPKEVLYNVEPLGQPEMEGKPV